MSHKLSHLSKKSYMALGTSFLVFGLVLSQLIFPNIVYALPSLSVDISANPSSGQAPLNDVDLTANVSGTATGDITYKFDCTNNGTWERTQTTSSTSYTATDLCDYSSPGNYTARVYVKREGLIFQGTTAIFIQSGPGLAVTLSANPSFGQAPLNDVDLTANVSGTATGDITYKFDCTNNGTWERTHTTSSTSYTAVDLCDYSDAGVYTAKVSVERNGLAFNGTIAIAVNSGDVSLNITKQAKNISKNQSSFASSVTAKPSETIEFQIEITSQGTAAAKDVFVKDTLPPNLIYRGNLKIDGSFSLGDIIQGFNIGDFSPNQSKTIVFEVQVASANAFDFGTTNLVNAVVAHNEETATTASLTVSVEKSGVAGVTDIPTGPINLFLFSLIITLLLGFVLSYVIFMRFYIANRILPSAFQVKTERNLKREIELIKKKEKHI